MKPARILATWLLALGLLALGHSAWARTGILVCQMEVSAFAGDAAQMAEQLSADQMTAVRQLVEVSRSQCRSNPDVVGANLSSMRATLGVASGPRTAGHFDEFWPASREELAALR